MKQSIVLLCLLVGIMSSCKNDAGSESGLATLNMSSLDQIKKLTGKDLNYYKITIKKNKGDSCTEGEITRTNKDTGKIELNTGKNDSCVYDLTAEYGKDSTLVLKGTTGIGPDTANTYPSSGNTINVKVTLEDSKGQQTQTTIANGTVTGTTKEVNINVCYDGKCDSDSNNTTATTRATVEVGPDSNPCEDEARKVLESSNRKEATISVIINTSTTGTELTEAKKDGDKITVNGCPASLSPCKKRMWTRTQSNQQKIRYTMGNCIVK